MISDSRINGSETVSGSKTFTTVSETVIVPNRADHGREIICRANHEALQSPIDKRMKLNVKSKLVYLYRLYAANYRHHVIYITWPIIRHMMVFLSQTWYNCINTIIVIPRRRHNKSFLWWRRKSTNQFFCLESQRSAAGRRATIDIGNKRCHAQP